MRILRFALAGVCTIASGRLLAQAPSQRPVPASVASGPGEIRGVLVDSATKAAIGSASVTVRRATSLDFVSGALPAKDGAFRVSGLPLGRYVVRIRAIGYAPWERTDVAITADHPVIDLRSIALELLAAAVSGTRTVAERADVVLGSDRMVYTTKNLPSGGSGMAADILRNIPLVEVGATNKISLRGNPNVAVQLNGRAIPLHGDQLTAFLQQLPAASVRSIEVATNPSVKEDPDGTAGIINIVLEQNAQLNLSGGMTANVASTGMTSASGNVGQQRGRLSAVASANVMRDRRVSDGSISRTNLDAFGPGFTETAIAGKTVPLSAGGNVRSEFRLNDRASLFLDAYGFTRRYTDENTANYVDFDRTRSFLDAYNQITAQHTPSSSVDVDLAFRRVDANKRPSFSTELEYANSPSTTDHTLAGVVMQGNLTSTAPLRAERDHTEGTYTFLNWKTDYTTQFGTATKLETGTKLMRRTTSRDFGASYLDPASGTYVDSPTDRSGFDYSENIGAWYILASNRAGRLQSQAGVRLEDAVSTMDLGIVDQHFHRTYASVYPSASVTWSLTPARLARLSYARRITRPDPFQLSPVEQRIDSRNLFHGNPALRAEYTDAIEAMFQDTRAWGTIQLSPYLRSTAHAVRGIQFVDSAGVTVSTFDNVASSLTAGLDGSVSVRHGPFVVGGGASTYRYTSDASNVGPNFSVRTFVWSTRANVAWTASKTVDAQLFASYRAPYATEGGSQISLVSTSMTARYKAWGDNGSLSLRISDPFNLQKFGYRIASDRILERGENSAGTRGIYLTITRTFGRAIRIQPKQSDPAALPSGDGAPPP